MCKKIEIIFCGLIFTAPIPGIVTGVCTLLISTVDTYIVPTVSPLPMSFRVELVILTNQEARMVK